MNHSSRCCSYEPLSRILARCRALRDDSGQALVELAAVVAFLGLPLVLGTTQLAVVAYDTIEVNNAAIAGAIYGMYSTGHASSTTEITAAARGEASDFPGTTLTVTPNFYYACSNSIAGPYPITEYTGSNAAKDAAKACTGGSNHAVPFIQVQTSATVTPFVSLPGLPKSWPITSTAVQEVQQ